MESNRKEIFARNRSAAKKNLTRKLGRNPSAAEILGLVGVRRRGESENSFYAKVQQGAESRAALAAEAKAAGAAAAAAVRMKVKAAKMEAKLLMSSNTLEKGLTKKARTPEQKTAAIARGSMTKKAAREQAAIMKEEARKIAKAAKMEAKEAKAAAAVAAKIEAAQLYDMQKAAAAQNLRSVLGKNPRMANVLRLAGLRRSGVNVSVDDFLKVARYGRTIKNRNSSTAKRGELNAFSPDMDPCAQCELKKFLEKED